MRLHNVPNGFDASRWTAPSVAIASIRSALGSTEYGATDALLQRLRGGMVLAIAAKTIADGSKTKTAELMFLDRSTWNQVEHNDPVWSTGDLTYAEADPDSPYGSRRTVRHYTVRLDPKAISDLEAEFSASSAGAIESDEAPGKRVAILALPTTEQAKPASRNKGGRPSKPWWEDFWVEMCRLLHEGKIFEGMKQADIARLMEQWVSDQGYDAGPTVIKDAARKLHKAINSARSET